VADVERMQMSIEAPTRAALHRVLSPWTAELPGLRATHKQVVRWFVDVDPLEI
jgi:primosomal protein N' (replication factor Y)